MATGPTWAWPVEFTEATGTTGPRWYVMFDDTGGANGVLSNSDTTAFTLAGWRMKSAEHALAWQKARAAGDMRAAGRALKAPSPVEARWVRQSVRGVGAEKWEARLEEEMMKVARAKFAHAEMARWLEKTGEAGLAAMLPDDTRLGTGLPADTGGAADRSRWRGSNILGRVLAPPAAGD